MTITDFLTLHTSGIINFTNWINVLYNPTNTPDTGKITAVSVTTKAFSFNGSQEDSKIDITNILEQIEEINFTFSGTTYTFTIIDKTLYTGDVPFFFFEVESDKEIPNIFAAAFGRIEEVSSSKDIAQEIQVNFTPILSGLFFSYTDFNPLYNNGNELRKSKFKFKADRLEGFTKPTNFDTILNTSASFAEIQDSFYSSTGITNSRYNGTKTTPIDYAGVSPSLTAKEFLGEIHSSDSNPDTICTTSRSNRISINLLHTGENTLPSFTSSPLFIENEGVVVADDTVFEYVYSAGRTGQISPDIDPGDIIVAEGSQELIRVVVHNRFTKTLQVQRGYLNTSREQILLDTAFFKVDRTDIFKIDDFVSSLSAVNNSLIYVEDLNSIVYTDDFGLVYSSSLCPSGEFLFTDQIPNT